MQTGRPVGQPVGDPTTIATVRRLVERGVHALAALREEIDALNVYPVADGDTGTNMLLTLTAARDTFERQIGQVESDGPESSDESIVALSTWSALSRGGLLGARGNSGVILSQWISALVQRLSVRTSEEPDAEVLAAALRLAADAAYDAVGKPVEGTMLTVARAAADAASVAAGHPDASLENVLAEAARAARSALARTPEQLSVLAEAGVVDAGGLGLCVLLDAASEALTGEAPIAASGVSAPPATPAAPAFGAAYEVMYLLDADESRIAGLKQRLGQLGDSVTVAGSDRLWHVHVHVDDAISVGTAIEAGIEIGRPHRVQVTSFADQIGNQTAQTGQTATGQRRIVAIAAGPGLRALFEAAGAVVVDGGPGGSPSTQSLVEAILRCAATEVVVLTNDEDSVPVAQAAAQRVESENGVRVALIPTRAQVQGLAALAVHDAERGFGPDVLEMTATARHARHGAVTVATRRAMTAAGPCEPDDVLGAVEGDFVIIGDEQYAVATAILARLLGGGGELVTIVSGSDPGAAELAERCRAWVEQTHPLVDAVVYDGGQDRYPLLVGVE